MERGAAFSARRSRATRPRNAAATIPFVAIGGEKTRHVRVGRARIDSESGNARSRWRGENKNRKPKTETNADEHWALVSLSPPRGADGDAGEPSKRRDRAFDAGARAILRRSKPRASPVSCRPCSPVSCGRARFGAARERRVRARAPVRARARKKARKSPQFREREKTEGTRGWRVARRTSRRERNPSEWIAVWCTKISSEPSSGVMNPKPFWVLNHFTCARRRQEGASGNARSKPPSSKNPSVVVKHPRPREIGRPEAGERARRERRGRSSRGAPPATYLAGELRHRVSRWELRLERAARVRNGRRRLFPNATSAFFVLLAQREESESLG